VIKNDLVVKVSGKIDFEDENDVKILADKIITISDATEQDANFLTVEIDTNEVDKNNLLKIKTIVEKSPGKCKVLFKLIANDGETYKLQPDFTINPSQELLTNLRGVLGEKQVWIN
jgi:DNA polymerase III alpha subunit